MEFQFHIDKKHGYIHETIRGFVTLPAFMVQVGNVFAHPDWSPNLNGLADLREAELDLFYEDMAKFVEMMQRDERFSRGRWAFVVSQPVVFGMVRMLASLDTTIESIQIFSNIEDAEAWLISG